MRGFFTVACTVEQSFAAKLRNSAKRHENARHLADNPALPNTLSITITHLITQRHRYDGPMTSATPFTSDGLT